MKKLLDETTDELTRSLLAAGVMHRPPPGNKAKLLVALGAGGSVGLLSSKAFAWFSTGAGKMTVLGVAMGVAGAAYVVSPLWTNARVETVSAAPRVEAVAEEHALPAPAGLSAEARPEQPVTTVVPLLPSPTADGPQPHDLEARAHQGREHVGVKAAVTKPAKRSKTRRTRATESGPQPAVETPPAVGALAPASAEAVAAQVVDRSRLEAEVQLVDDMHWAARQNDRDALGRFVETYRLQFPDGQLKEEVAEFAARLDRPAAP